MRAGPSVVPCGPMNTLLHVCDVLLVLGFTLRLIRLVITDDLGVRLIQEPVRKWVLRHHEPPKLGDPNPYVKPWRGVLYDGLTCPFCVGFWLGVLAVLSLTVAWTVGGALLIVWRIVAASFTLNYIAAHIHSRLDD